MNSFPASNKDVISRIVHKTMISAGIAAATGLSNSRAAEMICSVCDSDNPTLCVCKPPPKFQAWYNPYNQRIFDTSKMSFLPPHPEIYLEKVLAKKSIVVIGEVHSNPCHHRLEFDIVKSLSNIVGKKSLAIGLEAFYRQHQRALDGFIFLHKDFEKLQADTNWKEVWGFDLNYYAKIFNFAAQNEIRLVGLNCPQPLVDLVYNVGLEQLPQDLRRFLPEINLGEQCEHLKRIFR